MEPFRRWTILADGGAGAEWGGGKSQGCSRTCASRWVAYLHGC